MGVPSLHLSSAAARAKAERVEAARVLWINTPAKETELKADRGKAYSSMVQKEGTHGLCCMHKKLLYLDYQAVFLVPVWHCLLYGVVKTFVLYLLEPTAKLSQASMRHIKQAEGNIKCTSDGRRFKCLLKWWVLRMLACAC